MSILVDHPAIVAIGVGVGWPIVVGLASVVHRRRRRLSFFMPRDADIRHHETWLSGRSGEGAVSWLRSANHCLWVSVSDDMLRVGPHFPFSLFFVPLLFDLEHDIPGEAVRQIESTPSWITGDAVRIRFAVRGSEKTFTLYSRNGKALVQAVEAIRRQSTPMSR